MFIIDRFEEGWALIESDDKSIFKLPRTVIPSALKEGDCIDIIVSLDKTGTENRKNQVSESLKKFFDE